MKKTLYISRSARIGADSFDLCYTFDKAESERVCRNDIDHMTDREREKSCVSVEGFVVDVLPGETAKDAAARLFEEDEMPNDPDFYEEM